MTLLFNIHSPSLELQYLPLYGPIVTILTRASRHPSLSSQCPISLSFLHFFHSFRYVNSSKIHLISTKSKHSVSRPIHTYLTINVE